MMSYRQHGPQTICANGCHAVARVSVPLYPCYDRTSLVLQEHAPKGPRAPKSPKSQVPSSYIQVSNFPSFKCSSLQVKSSMSKSTASASEARAPSAPRNLEMKPAHSAESARAGGRPPQPSKAAVRSKASPEWNQSSSRQGRSERVEWKQLKQRLPSRKYLKPSSW